VQRGCRAAECTAEESLSWIVRGALWGVRSVGETKFFSTRVDGRNRGANPFLSPPHEFKRRWKTDAGLRLLKSAKACAALHLESKFVRSKERRPVALGTKVRNQLPDKRAVLLVGRVPGRIPHDLHQRLWTSLARVSPGRSLAPQERQIDAVVQVPHHKNMSKLVRESHYGLGHDGFGAGRRRAQDCLSISPETS
jgi:hypothetical protein